MIASYNHEIDVKSEQRRNAEKAKKNGYHKNIARDVRTGGQCSECKRRVPRSEFMVKESSGDVRCIPCEKSKKHCVICSAPFYSRINNKKTCSMQCSRAYELKRAIERYQTLSARANASY